MTRFRVTPRGRTALPHAPYQYAQSDSIRMSEMAGRIIAAARVGKVCAPRNRHERRVEARHERKKS
jgi:hypothetical protein